MERVIAATFTGLLGASIGFSTSVFAETFILNDGTIIEGQITQSTNNTIWVMEASGAIVPLSLLDVNQVQLVIAGREDNLVAQLVGWNEGIYELRSQRYNMRVSNGDILSIEDLELGVGGPVSNGTSPRQQEQSAQPEEAGGQILTSQPISNATM